MARLMQKLKSAEHAQSLQLRAAVDDLAATATLLPYLLQSRSARLANTVTTVPLALSSQRLEVSVQCPLQVLLAILHDTAHLREAGQVHG